MTAHDDLDRQLTAFLRDGPDELPYESFDAVRDRTERTRQRVVIGPWRLPEMNKILTFGLAAAAVLVIGLFVGTQLLGGAGAGIGSDPPASSEPTATPESSEGARESAPPLSQTFTSTQHGYSISYPEGWSAQAATEPWTDSTFPLEFGRPHADWLSDPIQGFNLFLTVASQPIGDTPPEDWVVEQMASGEGCTSSNPTTVDRAAGLIGSEGCDIAVVTTAGRGYWIQLYTSSDDSAAVAPYDRTWFEEVLATIDLAPEDAVDAGPSPSS
jgi:hypothetical protein